MVGSRRKVVNELAIEIILRLIVDEDTGLLDLTIKSQLISKMYHNIVRYSIPSKKVLCRIICQVFVFMREPDVELQEKDLVSIMTFLNKELGRNK